MRQAQSSVSPLRLFILTNCILGICADWNAAQKKKIIEKCFEGMKQIGDKALEKLEMRLAKNEVANNLKWEHPSRADLTLWKALKGDPITLDHATTKTLSNDIKPILRDAKKTRGVLVLAVKHIKDEVDALNGRNIAIAVRDTDAAKAAAEIASTSAADSLQEFKRAMEQHKSSSETQLKDALADERKKYQGRVERLERWLVVVGAFTVLLLIFLAGRCTYKVFNETNRHEHKRQNRRRKHNHRARKHERHARGHGKNWRRAYRRGADMV